MKYYPVAGRSSGTLGVRIRGSTSQVIRIGFVQFADWLNKILSWSGDLPLVIAGVDRMLYLADLFQGISEWCNNGLWQLGDNEDDYSNLLREYFHQLSSDADDLSQALEVWDT